MASGGLSGLQLHTQGFPLLAGLSEADIELVLPLNRAQLEVRFDSNSQWAKIRQQPHQILRDLGQVLMTIGWKV